MVNFNIFDRLLGRKDVDVSQRPAEVPRKEDPEILAVREGNFQKALDAYLERPATEEERAAVRSEMTGGDAARDLEPLTFDEMRGRISRIWQSLGRVPELVPVSDVYEPMGSRQGKFEQELAERLGRDLTQDDLEDARAMFEGNAKIRAEWNTMVGEQISHYAAEIASRITRDRLRASRPAQNDGMEAAAK